MTPEPGRCRYCRGTEDNPSTTPDGEPCIWFDAERTVCNNWPCLRQYHIDQERAVVEAIERDRATRRQGSEYRRQVRDRRRAARRKKKAA